MTERGAQLKSEIRAMERQEYQYSGLTLDLCHCRCQEK